MNSVSLLSHMKTNGKHFVKLSIPIIKNTLKPPSATAVPAQEEPVVFLSREAEKLLEERKEAEKQKMEEARKLLEEKKEAERQKIKEARDELRGTSAAFKEIEKASQNARGHRIGEIYERLKTLVKIMRSALLFGDKRAAAQIAKEAAQLAKELKKLLADAGKSGRKNVSVPDINLSGESAESSDSEAPVEGVENTNGEEVSAEGEAQAAAQEQEMSAEAESQAAAQAQEAQSDTGQVEEGEEGEESEQSEQAENAEAERKVSQAADELKALARKSVEKQSDFENDMGRKELIRQIVFMLRAIMSMAKQTLKQKTSLLNNEPEDPRVQSNLEAEVARAEKEMEEAIRDIETSTSSIDSDS